jgi:hypothetical protein
MFRKVCVAMTAAITLASCAAPSDQISASYVSPLRYTNMSCRELMYELNVVSGQIAATSMAQDRQSSNDAAAMTVAALAFWPAIFLVGNHDSSSALSSMKGDFNALQGAAIRNGC